MFDKIIDMITGNELGAAMDSIDGASKALTGVSQGAQAAINAVGTDTNPEDLTKLTGALGGLVHEAGGLQSIVGKLGGLTGILNIAKQVDFPLGVDDLEPVIKQVAGDGIGSSILQGIVSQGISQIDSPEDLIGLAKKFL